MDRPHSPEKQPQEYESVTPDERMEDDVRQLTRLAVREDLDRSLDWTTVCIVPDERLGRCEIVSRQSGVVAGLVTLPWVLDEMDVQLDLATKTTDGSDISPGDSLAALSGNVRDLLTAERIVLNLLSRLCGVATLTQQFVKQVEGLPVRLYDTRKTTPGWRRIEKYAVHCGGGYNHRTGLFDGFLIKDNHLALGGTLDQPLSPYAAAVKARQWSGGAIESMHAPTTVEIEVDSLEQFREVLPASPDIVLLDNFSCEMLREAVAIRDASAPKVILEASGGVGLETVRSIGETGVDRISSGALTHQAVSIDLGLDWIGP